MTKRFFVCILSVALLLLLACCGGHSDVTDTQNPLVSDGDGEDSYITLTAEITELEPGLSAVSYEGDDGFELFLEKGGAGSDQEVLRFLTENIFRGGSGLSIGGGGFGCSTISVANTDGGYFFGRNFDWQTCDGLIVAAYPEEGYASISTVNLGFIRQGAGAAAGSLTDEMLTATALYAPLDGMNEKGLCVSVNMIQDYATIQQQTDKPDMTTTTAVRLLLNKAATVEDALELLERYDLHASFNYMVHFAIADSEGNSVAVEYVNNEMVVTETPILTNFYLAEGEKQGIGTQQSHTRFAMLEKALEENPTMSAAQVRDTLDSVSKRNFTGFESTEWSAVFDQSSLTAVYYHRENFQNGYVFHLKDTGD